MRNQLFGYTFLILLGWLASGVLAEEKTPQLRAGAIAIDITPEKLPVLVNGGMTSRQTDKVVDRLHARCLVLDDGTNTIAIVVVDSCMVPRDLLDEAKAMAAKATGIPTNRMLISSTHTHSAPSVMGALGTDKDEAYAAFLPARIARGITLAYQNLEPARIGWGSAREPKNIFCRRFIMKDGTARTNRFSGHQNDQAQMNPGHNNPNAVKRTGPVDDQVSVLSVQSKDGRPICLFANYSTHYAGAPALSADYFGVFATEIAKRIKAEEATPAFVGIMSNGTSGDANCLDFLADSRRKFDRFTVGRDTADAAFEAYQQIKYYDWLPIEMAEGLLTLDVRMPSEVEVADAKAFLQTDEGKALKTIEAVYARETVVLSQMPPTRELKLQALRIGPLGITAIPNEVYGITGLKLKKAISLQPIFNISLANGAEGYIPPPDQHKLGGYTTWRARSSCLEVQAEPKIRVKLLELLTAVAAKRKDAQMCPAASGGRQSAESGQESEKVIPPETASIQGTDVPRSPVSPADSLKHLHVRPGMVVEVVAAEPLIRDPIAFDWGPDGKLWVVEMLDYPTGLDGKGKPGGRVVYLEDENDDGKYDKSTVFVDGLNFPMGVMAWREGILVTAAPDILYITDTNNDGRADKTEKLYSGFSESNQQLRINGLRWGLDNWIYCAGGRAAVNKGERLMVKSHKTGEQVDLTGRDFRIKPDEGLIEPLSGWSQFGRNRDDWGNWFGCQNAKPMFHFVLEERYLKRNPYVTYPDPKVLISDVPGQRPVFPKSQPGKFHHASQAGRFTSACSAMIYRDNLLGEEFYGNSFVCEPVHNLVHREIVERAGVTFRSYKPKDEENTEFLASEDPWFRPVMVRTGPDGALWIADMYREIIEHPRWVKDDLKPIVDTTSGTKFGRIYRVYKKGQRPRPVPRIDQLDAQELVSQLESSSGTLRDMAHRQLVENSRDDVLRPLLAIVDSNGPPAGKLQTLGALEGLGQLTTATIQKADITAHPELCRAAIRFVENKDVSVAWLRGVAFGSDGNRTQHQALQTALTLGELEQPSTAEALFHISLGFSREPTILAAALSSLDGPRTRHAIHLLRQKVEKKQWPDTSPSDEQIQGFIDSAIGFEQWKAMNRLLNLMATPQGETFEPWQFEGLAYGYRKLSQPTKPYDEQVDLRRDESGLYQAIAKAADFARLQVVNHEASPKLRIASLRLVGVMKLSNDDRETLGQLLEPRTLPEIQKATIEVLAEEGDTFGADLVLSRWNQYGPQMRDEVVGAMLSSSDWSQALLTKVEQGWIKPADLSASQRQQLMKSSNVDIRKRATQLFAATSPPEVTELIAHYRPSMSSQPNAEASARGAAVFKNRCASCHRLGEQGTQVGPDLRGLTDKSPGFLLTSILDPNRAVDPRYVSYRAVTNSGRIHTGLIESEAGDSLTLLTAEGKRVAVLRRDLDELTASGKSLMPEGLHQDISPAQMADLLAYLKTALAQP